MKAEWTEGGRGEGMKCRSSMRRTHRTVRLSTAVSFRDPSPRSSSSSVGRSHWSYMKTKAWWSCDGARWFSLVTGKPLTMIMITWGTQPVMWSRGTRDVCRQRERWRPVQFCCSMRFSSSSADRSRKAADSRYPAISWRTAATSVWLSWAEAPPPPPFLPRLLELDEDEFDARDFILRSVGPKRRE